ncbi:nucleoside phosphatase family-domain-containing protein [Thamnidium elegans]|nr:nucleoside phosphatase family-domain-containing protein [Thamnidium elegans]
MSLSKATPEEWQLNRKYGVIIDAGSSGSRIYVYSWKDHEFAKNSFTVDELKGKIPIVERGDQDGLKWTSREEPGISTFGTRPHEVGEHLTSLLSFSQEVVPIESHSTTPIFLMATAGMRLLPNQEQKELLSSTCNYMRENTNFFISDCDSHVRIIPGELEGVFGWVAVNYLMGGFDSSIKAYTEKADGEKIEQHHTFGFLDMGGASAQIAFEPEHHQKQEHMDDLTHIELHTLDGRTVNYDVFVTTFLGYGSNEARRRYLEDRVKKLFASSNNKNLLDQHHLLPLDDPCLPLNLNVTDATSTSVSLSLHGTGDFEKCIEYTEPLLNKDADCPTKPCLFNGVHTPNIDWSVNKFVGISEYWYSSHDILGLGGVYDFIEYENKASDYCSRDWSLIANNKDITSAELHRYQMQCFKSAWIVNILHEGIEIPRIENPSGHQNLTQDQELLEQTISSVESKNWNPPFQSIDTINDVQVSWTLGAMLLHVASKIPLVDHSDGFLGHNTDDEGAHEIADGVSQGTNYGHTNSSKNGFLDDVRNTSKHTAIGIALFMFLCVFFIWFTFKNIRKRRNYRNNQGTAGGLLGPEPIVTSSSSSSPSSWNPFVVLSHMSHALARSTAPMRHWISRTLRSNQQYTSVSNTIPVDMETFDDGSNSTNNNVNVLGNDASVSINMVGNVLGTPTKSPSVISKQYWSKKRYSGDSHTGIYKLGDVVEGSSVLPFRTSSALGLANRNGSTSNLIARNGSSPNLNGLNSPAIDRAPSPLANDGNNMSRSRSRMGFIIHEQSDEEDYVINDGPLIENAAATWLQSSSRLASPKASPRGSLDERRKKKEDTE